MCNIPMPLHPHNPHDPCVISCIYTLSINAMMARRRYSLHAYIGDPLGVAHMTCIMGRFVHILICIGSDILYLGISKHRLSILLEVFSLASICASSPASPCHPMHLKTSMI